MISTKTTEHIHMAHDKGKDKETIEKSKTITQIDEEHSEMSDCFSITSVTRAESKYGNTNVIYEKKQPKKNKKTVVSDTISSAIENAV